LSLVEVSRELGRSVDELAFGKPVTHVYNPLAYAKVPHELYLERYGKPKKKYLLLGMNPGPFGMAQTGVPFGEVAAVRDWLRIEGPVSHPKRENDKRPIEGFLCARSEVSGKRLWGFFAERFQKPERFFRDFFVWNYCPLAFMEASGKNFTPDKLPKTEREPLFEVCDHALRRVVEVLRPTHVIGVGAFAEKRATLALADIGVTIGCMLHPSPASPLANKGWSGVVERELRAMGIELPRG
jgi:single-strand selective monofunctional uracil DNA glycosylase